MAIVPTTGINPVTPTTPTLGVTEGGTPDILTFFRELRAFLEIPVVQDIIRQKMQVQSNSGGGGGVPEQPYKPQKHNVPENKEVSPPPAKKEPVATPEEFIMKQIATPEGRKSLSEGIERIKELMGDVKLSVLQKELTSGDEQNEKKDVP